MTYIYSVSQMEQEYGNSTVWSRRTDTTLLLKDQERSVAVCSMTFERQGDWKDRILALFKMLFLLDFSSDNRSALIKGRKIEHLIVPQEETSLTDQHVQRVLLLFDWLSSKQLIASSQIEFLDNHLINDVNYWKLRFDRTTEPPINLIEKIPEHILQNEEILEIVASIYIPTQFYKGLPDWLKEAITKKRNEN